MLHLLLRADSGLALSCAQQNETTADPHSLSVVVETKESAPISLSLI
jgi:hypothetical protein